MPLHESDKLQQGRVKFDLGYAAVDQPTPLTAEVAVGSGAVMVAGALPAEAELKASATWKELLQSENATAESKHAAAVGAVQAAERKLILPAELRGADSEFGAQCVGAEAERELEKEEAELKLVHDKASRARPGAATLDGLMLSPPLSWS